MKKTILFVAAIALGLSATLFTSCTSSLAVDMVPPAVTLQGNAEDVVIFKSANEYNDPGATALDKKDGSLNVVVSGTVNMNAAGDYILTYTATDKNGNHGSKTRKVIVDAGPYFAGNWTQIVTKNGTAYPAESNIQIAASTMEHNKVILPKFAGYNNAAVEAALSGITLDIPPQSFVCGNDNLLREFTPVSAVSFYGNSTHATNFTVTYTVLENGVTVNCSSLYTFQ
jgi:hypothetical protein